MQHLGPSRFERGSQYQSLLSERADEKWVGNRVGKAVVSLLLLCMPERVTCVYTDVLLHRVRLTGSVSVGSALHEKTKHTRIHYARAVSHKGIRDFMARQFLTCTRTQTSLTIEASKPPFPVGSAWIVRSV
jgi:hypothetical protein